MGAHRRLTLVAAVSACVGLLVADHPLATAQSPDFVQRAVSILPPGNSMTYTADGVAAGNASGEPDDYGPWVDDQREMYWNYEFKDARFVDECDSPDVPKPGVRVCWSEFGVPAVFADSDADLWWGSGWVAARLRLFLLEATVRTARGTLAEIAGPGSVAADVQRRYERYSESELTEMVNNLSPDASVSINQYVAGVNDYIDWVTTEGLELLPAEYVALTIAPTKITAEDVIAVGIEMVRFVAVEGRREMRYVTALRALEATFGKERGRGHFLDLLWQEDARAATTILASEGVFPRTSATAADRAAAFEAMADFASTIPLELAEGPGIELHEPDALGAGEEVSSTQIESADFGTATAAGAAARNLEEFRQALEGGSYMAVIGPDKTADGSTLLVSEPQLSMAPNVLMEVQLTGGQYNARGVTVAGIPVVGIGYTPSVAWALTTGNAKTIDTYIEESRPDSNGDGAPEYLHDGAWKDMACRDEVVNWRDADPVAGVPVGLPINSETHQVCRTVHGPVVSHTDDWSASATWQYHVFGREVDTIEAVLIWNRAKTFDDMADSIQLATWNENIGVASSDGQIGYWHPGLHRERNPDTDLRLPIPGTGEYDNGDYLPLDSLPKLVNPTRDFVVNWNNKPAHGWLDGGGMSETSYPAGVASRVATLHSIVGGRDDWTFDRLVELDRSAASQDFRAPIFLPLLLDLQQRADLSSLEQDVLGVLGLWDGSANGPGADMEFEGFSAGPEPTSVGAGPTIFQAFLDSLTEEMMGFLHLADFDLLAAQTWMGRHHYDMSPVLHLAARTLDPSTSSLTPSWDYTNDRTPEDVVRAAFATAVSNLSSELGNDPTQWRSVYSNPRDDVCSPAGVIGPCGVMPFLERGAWIHYVAFVPTNGVTPAPPPAASPADGQTPLPATGGGLIAVGLGALGLTALGSRRTMTARTRQNRRTSLDD